MVDKTAARRARPLWQQKLGSFHFGWMLAPITILMLGGYLFPLLQSFINSFHPNAPSGIDASQWTLANYTRLFDPFYVEVYLRTLRISVVIMLATAALAYPVAVYLLRARAGTQAVIILSFLAPWLVNVVVKAFGWSLLLRNNGIINQALMGTGLIDRPLRLMYSETGIVIALTHGHFLFVLLPLWVALKSIDPNLAWAAANLGARPWSIFWRITLPLTIPALISGMIINFTMNMAAFATPALIGGSRVRVVSVVAYEANLVELNWPFGGAISVTLLVLAIALIWIANRAARIGAKLVA